MNKNNFWKNLPLPFSVLAPMENVTDFVFREIVANQLPKPDVLFTEFTNVDALSSSGYEKTIHRFKFTKSQHPIVAQIWGTNPDNFKNAAKIAYQLGFDGIDINMGCPVKAVIKIGACSALINNRILAKEIIKATKDGSKKLPVSVKTRIGFNKVQTEEWITFLLEQKIDALTIHGRTAKQMSDVPANWEEISKAVNIKNTISPDTIIIGNGDITNQNDIMVKHKKYGVDGVMIGRGIFKNPWIFEKNEKKHSWEDYKDVLIKHLDLYDQEFSDEHKGNYDALKKFFKMYINNFDGSKDLRTKLMSTKNTDEARNLI